MTESTGAGGSSADEITATPSGKAAAGEGEDLHGAAHEVYEDNQEGGADEAAKTPGA